MIIKPEINDLGPAMSIAGSSTPDRATRQHDGPSVLSPDYPPPPYTLIDPQVIDECQELGDITPSLRGQFWRQCESMMNRIKDPLHDITSDPTATIPGTSGLQEIQNGGRQIVDSTMLFVGASLVAAGGAIEGVGRIVSGLGRSLASSRAYLTRKNN